ncbi:MAG: hypothetical protein KAQ94_04895 [Arcobacteraceae bacterium]|nr:hypothetical protein [Arcobacteraceae bacterium]
MQFKYYFSHLSIKEKVLAFLIIPLLLFLLFSIIEESFLSQNNINMQKQIKVVKSAIKKLKFNISKPNNISTIKFIENIATHFKIQISSIKINKSYFDIKTMGNYQSSINFLIYIEQNMKTKSLQIYKDGTNTIMQGKFKINKLSNIDDLTPVKNIPNPFIQIKQRTTVAQNSPLKLVAIFDQTVCINDKWYKKNDIVDKYTIKEIFTNHIELTKNHKIIKLEIYKNE